MSQSTEPVSQKNIMNKEQWIIEIKRLAAADFGFTGRGIEQTDWDSFYDIYAEDNTPEQALISELTT